MSLSVVSVTYRYACPCIVTFDLTSDEVIRCELDSSQLELPSHVGFKGIWLDEQGRPRTPGGYEIDVSDGDPRRTLLDLNGP